MEKNNNMRPQIVVLDDGEVEDLTDIRAAFEDLEVCNSPLNCNCNYLIFMGKS
jgi:hypothetical protein